jgi:hypothetical protein
MNRIYLIAAAFVLSAACNRVRRAPDVDSVQHLQAQFNTGLCDAIYAEAGANFQRQSLMEWRRQCVLLKTQLGAWKTFQLKDRRKLSIDGPLVVGQRHALPNPLQSSQGA